MLKTKILKTNQATKSKIKCQNKTEKNAHSVTVTFFSNKIDQTIARFFFILFF